MTQTRVETRRLIEILEDLTRTAAPDGTTCGVLLHTARGYADPGQPGVSDLLVGTSTNGHAIGHTWIGAAGKTPPMLWHLNDVRAVRDVFKACAKGIPDHHVDIIRDGADISVAEDPQLFGETVLRFTARPMDDYPRDVWQVVEGSRVAAEDIDTEAMPRTDLDPRSLTALAVIANRRKEAVRMFRTHQRRPILVEIGTTYRGAVMPWRWDEDGTKDGDAPSTDLYAPKLPAPSTTPKDVAAEGAEKPAETPVKAPPKRTGKAGPKTAAKPAAKPRATTKTATKTATKAPPAEPSKDAAK